jgi:hypothetical protein
MPPTFLIFLGLIVYIGIMIITILIFVPMLFINTKKTFAKKAIATALFSFPSLIVTAFVLTMIFVLPGLLFLWILKQNYLPQKIAIALSITAMTIFIFLIAICSLYIWYFISKLIYKYIEKKAIKETLKNDKVFAFLKPHLKKIKIIRNNRFLIDEN